MALGPCLPLAGALLGLILGSFIATLVIRWPQGKSVAAGRSRCDGCGHRLRASELVPILSHLVQRGRCRACGQPIDKRHLYIELASMLIGATALWVSPDAAGLAGAVFGWLLLALAALDAEHFWLPDRLTLPLAAIGLCAAYFSAPSLSDRLIGAAAGYGALWLIATLYRALRGREGLGGGDPKLLGAIGVWLGWPLLPAVLLGASLLGLLTILLRMRRGEATDAKTQIPLGALMAVAAWPLWIIWPQGLGA